MELSLKNKTVLITGSSKGIGMYIAKSLYENGCNVILNGRHEASLKKAKKFVGKNSTYFVCDVTKSSDCERLTHYIEKNHKKLDVLICNVGSGRSVSPGKENLKDWKHMFEQNFFSTINVIQATRKILKKSKSSIICISSIAGIEATKAPIAYSVSKSALNAFVKGISNPFAKEKIRINAVAPGNIFFKGSVWEDKLKGSSSKVKKMLKDEVALERFGKPEEVANLVTYLASPKSSFITGAIFVIDGGQIKSWM